MDQTTNWLIEKMIDSLIDNENNRVSVATFPEKSQAAHS